MQRLRPKAVKESAVSEDSPRLPNPETVTDIIIIQRLNNLHNNNFGN